MGRHRAEPPVHDAETSSVTDIALWGGFTTIATAFAMAVFGISTTAIALLTSVVATAFILAWWLGLFARRAAVARIPDPSPKPKTPFQAGDAESVASRTQSAATGPVPDVVEPDSRWIDTFGPPATGQLPIQLYVRSPESVGCSASTAGESALPQWSHSRG